MIDQKGALLYAVQLYNVLHADDPREMLNNPIVRAMLMSLTRDLAAMVEGRRGDELRAQVNDVRVMSDEAGEIFIIG